MKEKQNIIQGGKKFLALHFMMFDIFKAFLISVIIFIIIRISVYNDIINGLKNNYGTFFGTLAQIMGALLGFAITGFSIVVIASEKKYLDEYKKAGHFYTLLTLFKRTIYLLGLGTLMSLAFLTFTDIDINLIIFLTILLLFSAGIFLYRCIQVIMKLTILQSLLTKN